MRERYEARKGTLRRLLGYFGPYKWVLTVSVILTIGSNLFALLGPGLSGKAIDAIGILPGECDYPLVLRCCLMMLMFYAASALLQFVLTVLMTRTGQHIVVDMRKELFRKLESLPVRFFDENQTGDLVSRFQYDIDTINSSLTNDIIQISASSVLVIGSFSMMISISPLLVLVFLTTVPFSFAFMLWRTKKLRPLFFRRSRAQGKYNGYTEELLSGQKTIKAYHQEESMTGKFDTVNGEAIRAFYTADWHASFLWPAMGFISNASLALISVVGSILFISGGLSIGGLSSFILYSRKFTGPINECANIISEVQSAISASDRVFRMLDEIPEPADDPDAAVLPETAGAVELEHVRFGYGDGKTVIKDLTLSVRPGERVAIVGPTGAGKTTIINLLMRFYDPESGTIRIDGIDSRRIKRSSLRGSFAMVLQDAWLFEGTIHDNIAYARPGASREDVIEACRAARIHSYIETLPDGYDTMISENGMNISQGQKQMLTIARAMLTDRSMLILDEATSNVDTRTEIEIQKAMDRLMKGKTCFIIAHRLSTVRNADVILVLSDGDIREIGDHGSLMEKGGIYASLYTSQFK